MLNDFDENRETASEQFPFEDIYARLDGDVETLREDAMRLAGSAIHHAFEWAAEPLKFKNLTNEEKLRQIGLRTLAALWTVSPEFVGGISGRQLSRDLGYCHAAVSEAASAFTRRFGIRNGAQAHGRNGLHASELRHGPTFDKVPSDALRDELRDMNMQRARTEGTL